MADESANGSSKAATTESNSASASGDTMSSVWSVPSARATAEA
jgi:hypothetical protein